MSDDMGSAVYKQKNISSGQPTVLRGDPPGYPAPQANVPTSNPPNVTNVTNVGSEFYSGKRKPSI